jgi:hypothetical protein
LPSKSWTNHSTLSVRTRTPPAIIASNQPPVLSRVQAFLPQLQASNAILAQADPSSVDIENIQDDAQYIEMVRTTPVHHCPLTLPHRTCIAASLKSKVRRVRQTRTPHLQMIRPHPQMTRPAQTLQILSPLQSPPDPQSLSQRESRHGPASRCSLTRLSPTSTSETQCNFMCLPIYHLSYSTPPHLTSLFSKWLQTVFSLRVNVSPRADDEGCTTHPRRTVNHITRL